MSVLKIKRTDGTWYTVEGSFTSTVVQQLPTTGQDGVLYLVPTTTAGNYSAHLWKIVDSTPQWVNFGGGGTGTITDVTFDGVSVVQDGVARLTTDAQLANAKATGGIGWQEGTAITEVQWDGSTIGRTWVQIGTMFGQPVYLYRVADIIQGYTFTPGTHYCRMSTTYNEGGQIFVNPVLTTYTAINDKTAYASVEDGEGNQQLQFVYTSVEATIGGYTFIPGIWLCYMSMSYEGIDVVMYESKLELDGFSGAMWNGDTTGLTYVGDPTNLAFYRVYEDPATIDVAKIETLAHNDWQVMAGDAYILHDCDNKLVKISRYEAVSTGDYVYIYVCYQNCTYDGMNFTPGVWFQYKPNYYISYIIWKSGGITATHKIDSDYIDTSKAGASGKVLTSNGTGGITWGSAGLVDNVTLNGTSVVSGRTAVLTTVDNTTSAGNLNPLTANQGKILADRISNLESRGRYLAIWDCTTGYPTTTPTTSPYTYKSGDYYIVGTVASSGGTNYRPNGSEFVIGTHSTTVETLDVSANDYYLYDGTSWKLLKNTQKTVSFENIGGDPYDNTELAGALNAKSTVSVSQSGTSTTQVGYITVDGTEYKMAGAPTEQTVKLAEDLYTYVNIGKITGASQTNPVKVADQGDPLKDVFNAILGTEVDVNPTINQNGTYFQRTLQTGTVSANGGEIGQIINGQTCTIEFTVANTATCTYGLKAGANDTYSKTTATTFVYPIKTRSVEVGGTTYNYQVKIEYPTLNGCTITVSSGTLVKNDINGRILYCNVDNNNKVKLSLTMPNGSSTSSAQTRFGQLVADVDFDPASYNGTTVDNFWTYLKAQYNNGKTHSAITNVKSTAYTITAGAYYTYYKAINSTTMVSTGWTSVGSTSIEDIVVSAFAGDYIWFATPQNKTAIYEWNEVSGAYNADATATTKTSNQTIHTSTGLDVSTYYTYRTTNPRSGDTYKKFKLA